MATIALLILTLIAANGGMSLSNVESKLKNEIEKWQLLGIGDWHQDDYMDSYDSESDENDIDEYQTDPAAKRGDGHYCDVCVVLETTFSDNELIVNRCGSIAKGIECFPSENRANHRGPLSSYCTPSIKLHEKECNKRKENKFKEKQRLEETRRIKSILRPN